MRALVLLVGAALLGAPAHAVRNPPLPAAVEAGSAFSSAVDQDTAPELEDLMAVDQESQGM